MCRLYFWLLQKGVNIGKLRRVYNAVTKRTSCSLNYFPGLADNQRLYIYPVVGHAPIFTAIC